ncbi:hypothetical protein DL237_07435 [Pseudooceanicola sediminis]|uniref:Uncharacterized protein n=1 Tax=Pseudooceanicola sediminis TaxID=2211117 RepID=A0A399JA63_9RHOB|nr:hypothetical protein [Pseudooceanicola sediminis]KAA2314580.1 hypothetical protein E0K93_09710 [Puniceibacterium sp. HSS470]RII39546.1 hypothetical protein DL237_07435 [Pseudooceanicola sediminis]
MIGVRPQARRAITRWREALLGALVAAVGLWWMLISYGLVFWISAVILIAGLAMTIAGVQRGRFRTLAGGPGVVRIDEGQIGYFGPFTGGAVALSEITCLTLDPTVTPPLWKLSQIGQPDVLIPLNAEGADGLFDVFAALPGISTSKLVAQVQRAVSGQQPAPVVIWQRRQRWLH